MNFNATLIGQTIAMIAFVSFCMWKIWPPILNALEARRKEIADGLAASDKAEKAYAQAREEAVGIVAEARDQARGIVDQAGKRAHNLVDEAKLDGVKEKERQLASAQSEIEQEINRAKDELRTKVSTLALASAEKILAREIDATTHRDLLDRLASEL